MHQPLVEDHFVPDTNQKVILPWLVGLAASLFFFYEFILGNMFASIADDIMRDFHIQADKMAYLSSIHYLSNVLFLFIAGQLLDRFSPKKTILIAMALCVVSTFLLAISHSFYVALTCRFITGFGSAFCFLGPMRIVSRWFPSHRMALVTGVVVTIAMTGGLISQYSLTRLLLQFGWRESLNLVGWLGIGLFVAMFFGIKDKPAGYSEKPHETEGFFARAKEAYLNAQTFRAALYASLMNMAVAVFGAMMGSLYLMQRLDVTKEQAAMVNSMLFLGAIFGGPILGWFSDRIGRLNDRAVFLVRLFHRSASYQLCGCDRKLPAGNHSNVS